MTPSTITLISHPNVHAAARRFVATTALWGQVEIAGDRIKTAKLHHPAPHTEPEVAALWSALHALCSDGPNIFTIADDLDDNAQAAIRAVFRDQFGGAAERAA